MAVTGSSVRCYQYNSVYPCKGKELQLEQVRALLPRYRPTLIAEDIQPICSYQKNRVYPPLGGEFQFEQIRAMLPKYQYSCYCDMEMTEISTANITVFHANDQNLVADELEKLMCADKPTADKVTTAVLPTLDYGDGFEQELCRQLEQDKHVPAASQNKENERCYTRGKYSLSPATVDGGPNCPSRGDRVHTKLNFTDTESLLSVSGQCGNASLLHGQRPSNVIDGFNVASNLEDKAKFLHSQRELEEEFAVTEIGKPIGRKPLEEMCPSQHPQVCEEMCDESSFIPFHDSMRASSSFRKPCDGSSSFASGHESKLKPLQDLHPSQTSFGVYEGTFDESSFMPYHDSMQTSLSFRKPCHASMQARKPDGRKPLQVLHHSQHPQTSFGVCEGTFDESSFMPYHDSMQASSCENPGTIQDTNHREYSAPLGVPIVHYDQAICEQTFTQFDIAHPKSTDSVSTPRMVSQHRDLSMDLSLIPCDIEDSKPRNPMHPPQASKPGTLTPIKEESSASSKSSSRFTVSSSNSSGNSCQSVSSTTDQECNPFLPDMVNRMLNSLGGIPDEAAVQVLSTPVPSITPGQMLPGHVFHSTSLINKSRFSDIYLVQGTFGKQILQVYDVTVPLEWEVTILNQLHHRLQKLCLQELCCIFQQYCQVFQFSTSFITLSMYYSFGSIQTVIEKFDKKIIPECVVSYLSLEMFAVIGYLHQCGIIHAAIKPAHFLLCVTGAGLPARPGVGLRLIDFRAAIDTRQFPDDQLFTGTPPHLDTVVLDGQPWKWQLDYCGLAMCIMSLISGRNGVLRMLRDASGLYICTRKPYKKYNTPVWQELVKTLLNAVEVLPLHQFGEFLEEKIGDPKEVLRLLI